MLTPRLPALVACGLLVASCKLFDETAVQDIVNPANTATTRVKFHNFSPSSVAVNFFANDVKVSAIASTLCTPPPTIDSLRTLCLAGGREVTTGTAYSAVAAGGLYVGLAPGQTTLTAKMAAKDTIVSTVAQTLALGKYYSFFMSGIYNTTTKTAEAFVVEDAIPTGAVDYTVALVRFVNAVSNATGDLNLIATNTTTTTSINVGSAVAYKAAGTSVTLAPGSYNFGVRYTGVTTNLISRTGLTLEGGRVYTLTARGSTATASTLGVDFSSNQR